MNDRFVRADYTRLDKGLQRSLKRTTNALGVLRRELSAALPNQEPALSLWRWAIFYSVTLEDISRSGRKLLIDGRHSRAALILRRAAFEYYARFHFFWKHQEHSKTALDEGNPKLDLFADRVGPDEITVIRDASFDVSAFKSKEKPYKNFEIVCRDVYGNSWAEHYARFYSYPSSLLHGDALLSLDILELANDEWILHLDSRRPFTNEIAGNLIVFLLDFAGDVARAFDLKCSARIREIGTEFNASRRRLGMEIGTVI